MVGDIPTRVYEPRGARGLLLFGHGGGHSKDGARFVRLARRYARELQLAVACIDAVDHGERQPAVSGNGVPPGWHSRTTARMVADWQRVVDELSPLAPATAYVGFSMGAIFGAATVAAIPTIHVAVLAAGGIPMGHWTDDDGLEPLLLQAASGLGHAHVLMLDKHDDELFDAQGVRRLFAAVSARSKTLRFHPGGHDEWGEDLINESLRFLAEHLN